MDGAPSDYRCPASHASMSSKKTSASVSPDKRPSPPASFFFRSRSSSSDQNLSSGDALGRAAPPSRADNITSAVKDRAGTAWDTGRERLMMQKVSLLSVLPFFFLLPSCSQPLARPIAAVFSLPAVRSVLASYLWRSLARSLPLSLPARYEHTRTHDYDDDAHAHTRRVAR